MLPTWKLTMILMLALFAVAITLPWAFSCCHQ